MTSQEIRLLAIRLFGLYQGAAAVQVVVQVIAFASSFDSDITSLVATYANWSVAAIIHGAACYFCLAKTEAIANWVFADLLAPESDPEKRQRPFSMAFFIALLALYFIVSSVGQVTVSFVHYLGNLDVSDSRMGAGTLWANGITFILGILLLIGATLAERIITGRAPQLESVPSTDTNPENHDDN